MKSQFILSGSILVIAILVCPAGAVPLGTPGTHALEIDFTFTNVPAAAQTAAMEAGHRISNMLTVGSGITNQTITVDLTHSVLPMDVLGGATPQFSPGSPGIGFNGRMVPNAKAVTGVDTNGADADVVVEMSNGDNGVVWDFVDPVAGDQFDYQSTILHEVIHGMGFAEGIAENGGDSFSTTPGDPGIYSVWDEFVGDSTGPVIDGTTFAIDVARWNTAVVGGTGAIPPNGNGLYFYGPNAVAANGGQPVPLYSPSAGYESGSSGGGHLDTEFYGDLQRLMNHASPAGPDQRVLSPEELGMMADIGYRVVPEPSSILLLVLGFTGMATGIRRRRS